MPEEWQTGQSVPMWNRKGDVRHRRMPQSHAEWCYEVVRKDYRGTGRSGIVIRCRT